MKTLEERVNALEARLFRVEDDDATLLARTAAHGERIAHVSSAVDSLSADLRALTHEVQTQVVPRLDRIEADVSTLKTDVATLKTDMVGVKRGVDALLAHFNITPGS